MKSLSTVIVAAVGALSIAGAAPVFATVNHDLTSASSFDSAVELEVGTAQEPTRYVVQLQAEDDPESIDDASLIKVDIPEGHRLHAAFTLAEDAPAGAGIRADLLDDQGFRSDYSMNPTFNDYVVPEGLQSGYLRSDPMGPENRSYERETYLRLDPRTATGTELFDVHLTLTAIPEVIDGRGLEPIDRPSLRYPVDVEPVSQEQADEVFTGTVASGDTQTHSIKVDWMEAIDATAHVLNPGEGTLTFGLYNQFGEMMVLVGQTQMSADADEPVTFGQRSPLHYKNVTAANNTRNSGFMAGDLTLTVTYDGPADSEVEYEILAALRGEGVPDGTEPPSFDSDAAAQHHAQLAQVEHDYYPAPGYEDTAGKDSVWSNPLTWVAIGLGALAIIVALIALRRR